MQMVLTSEGFFCLRCLAHNLRLLPLKQAYAVRPATLKRLSSLSHNMPWL